MRSIFILAKYWINSWEKTSEKAFEDIVTRFMPWCFQINAVSLSDKLSNNSKGLCCWTEGKLFYFSLVNLVLARDDFYIGRIIKLRLLSIVLCYWHVPYYKKMMMRHIYTRLWLNKYKCSLCVTIECHFFEKIVI